MKSKIIMVFVVCVMALLSSVLLRWHRGNVAMNVALECISSAERAEFHNSRDHRKIELSADLRQQLSAAVRGRLSFPRNNVKRAGIGNLSFFDSKNSKMLAITVFSRNVIRVGDALMELPVGILEVCGIKVD